MVRFPYLVRTKRGHFRYRRRVPDSLRTTIGKTEFVVSLGTREERLVPSRHASVHSEVERILCQARQDANLSDDVLFNQALQKLGRLGWPEPSATFSEEDGIARSIIEDHLLAEQGFFSVEEFEEAFDKRNPAHRRLSMELGVANGSVSTPPLTLSYVNKLYLAEMARNYGPEDKDRWEREKRDSNRRVDALIAAIGDKVSSP